MTAVHAALAGALDTAVISLYLHVSSREVCRKACGARPWP